MFYFLAGGQNTVAFGGVPVIYSVVDWLNDARIDAAIVHSRRGPRSTWIENDTRIVYAGDVRLSYPDVVVFSEFRAFDSVARLPPGIPFVILDQAAYLTFKELPLGTSLARSPYTRPGLLAIVTVSEDSRRLLSASFPDSCVERIHVGIDSGMYRPPENGEKRRQIAFQTQKGRASLGYVLYSLKARGALDGWRLVPLQAMSTRDVAHALHDAAIYLSCGDEIGESLARLPAEAMSCGCLVVGYSGHGGDEFFRPEFCFRVQDGDMRGLLSTTERVLGSYEGERERFWSMGRSASQFIAERYTRARERNDAVDVFGRILNSCQPYSATSALAISREGTLAPARVVGHHLKQIGAILKQEASLAGARVAEQLRR
jgi:hypothetical protein